MAAAATRKRVASDEGGTTHKKLKTDKKGESKNSRDGKPKRATREQVTPTQKKSQHRKLPLTSAEVNKPEVSSDEDEYPEDVDYEMEDQPADEEAQSDEEILDVPKDSQKTNSSMDLNIICGHILTKHL